MKHGAGPFRVIEAIALVMRPGLGISTVPQPGAFEGYRGLPLGSEAFNLDASGIHAAPCRLTPFGSTPCGLVRSPAAGSPRGASTRPRLGVAPGTGSSGDWAAKGTQLPGVKAVVARSFERIHGSNLMDMGVLPFQFKRADSVEAIGIRCDEEFDIAGLKDIRPQMDVALVIWRSDGSRREVPLLCRIDTPVGAD